VDLDARWLVWEAERRLRRAARDRRRQLVRELGDYRTPAQRDDLLAAIDRCPHQAREEIRALLTATAVHTGVRDASCPTRR
jgi:hypothetical protein